MDGPLEAVRPVSAVTVMTEPLPEGARGSVEAHVPGEGWRKLADAAASGWTQADAAGVRADAVRLSWQGAAPAVRQVVPWFADGPEARFELADGARTDAEIGGAPRQVSAQLSALRPGEVRGPLSAAPPPGVQVRIPAEAKAPRGTQVAIPVEVSVARREPRPGSIPGPGHLRRANAGAHGAGGPRTGGPDLLRGARATSSGNETPAFPASAAVDGSDTTRWSSPAVDGAWWQAELAVPARVGLLTCTGRTPTPRRTGWRPPRTARRGAGRRP
ncbi:hypothetical protein ACFSNO_26755 [Streptomyces cirratus]